MLEEFLISLDPNGDRLLSSICGHVTDDMLAEISLADYGEEQECHLAPLRRMRDAGRIVEPMEWCPGEVLALIRNSQPEPGSTGIRGHWMRSFACAALLRAREAPWHYRGDAASPSDTLVRLIESLDALRVDLTSELVNLVAWMMLQSDLERGDEQAIYYGVALMWLTLNRQSPPLDQHLTELAEWMFRRESEIRKHSPRVFERWLLGIGNDPPPSAWERLGRKLSMLNLRGHSTDVQAWVSLIGGGLAGAPEY